MDEIQFCCEKSAATGHTPTKPFSKIIALGFYDGPTAGVLQCSACGADYHFDMLDWDEEHEVRIFRLALLPNGSMDRCVAILEKEEEARWPVWVPFARTRPPENLRAGVSQQLDLILSLAAPATRVVAWSGYGDKLLAAGNVPASVLMGLADWFNQDGPDQGRDWFGVLGLSKGRAGVITASIGEHRPTKC